MPQFNEVVKNRKTKKFVKRSYRPWDLSGTETDQKKHTENAEQITKETTKPISNDILVNKENHPEDLPIKLSNDISNNQTTVMEPIENITITTKKQLDNLSETISVTDEKQLSNEQQKVDTYNKLIRLTGLQKGIIECVIDICSSTGDLETGPIETSAFCEYVESSIESIKTSINRLINKGLIVRKKGKTARGGYINLAVSNDVFTVATMLRKKLQTKPVFKTNLIMKQLDNNSLYSSNNINNTTKEMIPEEWDQINIDPLSEIGFTKNQIKQLIGRNEPTIVQESINHFSFGLNHNPKVKKYEEPLNVIMGVLRKGQAWFEKNYFSVQDLAQLQLIENKKAELERKKQLESEAYQLALTEWQQRTSDEEIERISSNREKGDITPKHAKISLYFKNSIWPGIRNEYIIGSTEK